MENKKKEPRSSFFLSSIFLKFISFKSCFLFGYNSQIKHFGFNTLYVIIVIIMMQFFAFLTGIYGIFKTVLTTNLLTHSIIKILLFIIGLLLTTVVFSQEKNLKVTNTENRFEKVYKENKRIKVKTLEGEKLKGKLQIMDEKQIMLGDNIVPINSIYKIQRNPFVNILYTTVFAAIAGFVAFASLVVGITVVGVVVTAGFVFLAIRSTNFVLPTTITDSALIEVME